MLIKSDTFGRSMWTDDDKAVQAFAELLLDAKESFDGFLQTLWPHYQKSKSPNLGLLFTVGKFQARFIERSGLHSGEEVRDTLHHVLNDMLKEPSTRALVERFVADASDSMGA